MFTSFLDCHNSSGREFDGLNNGNRWDDLKGVDGASDLVP